jgi:hypothetical protein
MSKGTKIVDKRRERFNSAAVKKKHLDVEEGTPADR